MQYVTTNAYQDQINAGFSKVCEIFKVRSIESLKYIWEFHTPVCYCGDISTPRNVTLNEINCDWLFDMSVKRPNGRALANESCHLFQTFSRQSEGLATRDYIIVYSTSSFSGKTNKTNKKFPVFGWKCCRVNGPLYFIQGLFHINIGEVCTSKWFSFTNFNIYLRDQCDTMAQSWLLFSLSACLFSIRLMVFQVHGWISWKHSSTCISL